MLKCITLADWRNLPQPAAGDITVPVGMNAIRYHKCKFRIQCSSDIEQPTIVSRLVSINSLPAQLLAKVTKSDPAQFHLDVITILQGGF